MIFYLIHSPSSTSQFSSQTDSLFPLTLYNIPMSMCNENRASLQVCVCILFRYTVVYFKSSNSRGIPLIDSLRAPHIGFINSAKGEKNKKKNC